MPVDMPATLNLSQNAIIKQIQICSEYERIIQHAVGVIVEFQYNQVFFIVVSLTCDIESKTSQ